MTNRAVSPKQLEQTFARAAQLRVELQRKERAVGGRVQLLAKGLASLMEPGWHLYRIGIGLHAFDVDGEVCLAAAYLETNSGDSRYRYAVLCGGDVAKRALRTATLDPGDSDEPVGRRIALADYDDYDDFLYRLPKYVGDVVRRMEDRIALTEEAEAQIQATRRQLSVAKRAARTARGVRAS